MTYQESDKLIELVSLALQHKHPSGFVPVSLLCGYDIIDVINALKLQTANAYLCLHNHPNFEKIFNDTVQSYDATPWNVMNAFVADKDINSNNPPLALMATDPLTMKMDDRLASMETISSFGDFCKAVGHSHPHYWANVYKRIGLEYNFLSPSGNSPQPNC